MANKILLVFVGFDLVFLLSAGLLLFIPLYTGANIKHQITVDNVAQYLLLEHCPLQGKTPRPLHLPAIRLTPAVASLANAMLMFLTFLVSVPALFKRSNRTFLRLHAWGVVASALLTLTIGLIIWFSTLETHKNLKPIFTQQPASTISLLQAKFQCCGYDNPSLFTQDATCTSAARAAQRGPCVGPFGTFANQFLDIVFTTFFGFVAIDMMLLLAALCLIKDRREKQRYRLIDEKQGFGQT